MHVKQLTDENQWFVSSAEFTSVKATVPRRADPLRLARHTLSLMSQAGQRQDDGFVALPRSRGWFQ